MVDFTQKAQYTVEDLRRIVALLRAPGGCPWDGAQTHESIRRNFIEEAYEVAEAIDEQSPAHLKEELGDVLLQVVFHASLEEDAGRFDLDDVADGICKKLIFRHPHVFGVTSPITYTIFSDNFICLFRQLLPYSAIVSYALSFDIIRLRVFLFQVVSVPPPG